jgi:hypothetical protein
VVGLSLDHLFGYRRWGYLKAKPKQFTLRGSSEWPEQMLRGGYVKADEFETNSQKFTRRLGAGTLGEDNWRIGGHSSVLLIFNYDDPNRPISTAHAVA